VSGGLLGAFRLERGVALAGLHIFVDVDAEKPTIRASLDDRREGSDLMRSIRFFFSCCLARSVAISSRQEPAPLVERHRMRSQFARGSMMA